MYLSVRGQLFFGVKIGRGAVVGAGAVVTKDVEEMTIVEAFPQEKLVKKISELNYKLGRAAWFR